MLQRLTLPVTVAEVVAEQPAVLRHAEVRTNLLADAALAHTSLRQYIRYVASLPRSSENKRLPLRQRLARDISTALGYSPDMHLLGIVKYGEMGLAQAGKIKRSVDGAKESRKELLTELNSRAAERLGPAIIESYFAQKPLTNREQQEFPSLIELSPGSSPGELSRTIEKAHARPLDEEDITWMEEVMAHTVTNERKEAMFTYLNNALAKGSRTLRGLDELKKNEVLSHRREFYRRLGWTIPGHPLYGSFSSLLERHALPAPDKVVAILRVLAEPAKGQLMQIIGWANCGVLRRRSPVSVQRRINIASTRAKRRRVSVGKVLSEYASWFLGPTPRESYREDEA